MARIHGDALASNAPTVPESASPGMPNLALIRLPPVSLDARVLKLLLTQPAALASMVGMVAFAALVGSSLLTGAARTLARWLFAAWCIGHANYGHF